MVEIPSSECCAISELPNSWTIEGPELFSVRESKRERDRASERERVSEREREEKKERERGPELLNSWTIEGPELFLVQKGGMGETDRQRVRSCVW